MKIVYFFLISKYIKDVLISMNNDIEGHSIAPIRCKVVNWNIISIHVLPGPLQQRFLGSEPLLRVVALNHNFFNLEPKNDHFG